MFQSKSGCCGVLKNYDNKNSNIEIINFPDEQIIIYKPIKVKYRKIINKA